MYDLFIAPFAEFDFMRRALAGVIILSLSAAPIGIFLMLRRMSLAGDVMAHAILPGAALGFLVAGLDLFAMTVGGIAAGVTVAVAAGLVARFTELKEDAALAAFYLVSLALGVTLISLKGSNVDLFRVLFGSVLALDNATLLVIASFTTFSLFALALIWRPLVLECVDPGFLRSVSGSGTMVHLLFLALVVLNLVAAFHALGTLLAVGMMMLPAAAARFWTQDVTRMAAYSVLIGVVSGVGGLLVSFHFNLPTGPAVILTAGIFYALSVVLGPVGGLRKRLSPGRHLEA
ncbi:MAG: metal ABC transporter permease [Rhizobiales bacterium]|jgi:zinc/manganese transport system permease protein|nr:metal ABC transporter permease [Hyphomicrobiales bacterium]